MNYEIHGNSIPHLHLHLYPRFRGDPYEGRAIDGRSASFERSPEDLERIRGAIEPLSGLKRD
jgi:diadenosine tetraphosphate (Ap4A) HIT family hydrolase